MTGGGFYSSETELLFTLHQQKREIIMEFVFLFFLTKSMYFSLFSALSLNKCWRVSYITMFFQSASLIFCK